MDRSLTCTMFTTDIQSRSIDVYSIIKRYMDWSRLGLWLGPNLEHWLSFVLKRTKFDLLLSHSKISQIARFMGPTWDPPGADRTQVGPMLAPWTLLSGYATKNVRLKSKIAMPIEVCVRCYLWSYIVPVGCDLKYTCGLFFAVVCICVIFRGTICILTHTLRVCSPRHWDNHTIEFCPSTNGVILVDMGDVDEYQNKTQHNQTWAMYMTL